ncbi:MAG: DHH family phosphoesterase [Acholeplasmataceae bacterium]|jgi:phosphoesterase RecJ-like protein
MSYKLIKKKIEQYNTIIIHRHTRPDLDALGSQLGLKEAILATYPHKNVYVVGDENNLSRVGVMDQIDDSKYHGALVFIVDVAITKLIADDRYHLASEIIIIDHHTNPTDIDGAIAYIDTSYEAAAAYIADILFDLKFKISERGADLLLSGIITDSGRFQYLKDGERLFKIAAKLMGLGANPVGLYEWLYTEDLEVRLMKYDFQSRIMIENGVAFLKNTLEDVSKYPDIDVFTMSRGMVNLMAGIDGVPIWANFTYDPSQEMIMGEFRSRGLKIVDVAKKYGGGGHDNACGALLESWELVDAVIKDFKELIESK